MAKKKTKKGKTKSKKKSLRKAKPKKKTRKKSLRSKRKPSVRKKTAKPRAKAVSGTNKRKFPRVPLKLKIDYFKDPGVFLYDYSQNLGRGGLFIETPNPFPAGTEMQLSFSLPEQIEPVELKAKVVWVYQAEEGKLQRGIPGMGVQFHNPEGRNKEALDRFFREIDYDNLTF